MNDAVPRYLTVADVIALYEVAMQESGQETAALVRPEALQSAVHHPRNLGFYVGASVAEQAVELMLHLAVAHAWVDGNKRISTLALYAFVTRNGARRPSEGELRKVADHLISWLSVSDEERETVRQTLIHLVEGWMP